MGYIKEPKGVDFLIAPSSKTNEDIAAISDFIARQNNNSNVNLL